MPSTSVFSQGPLYPRDSIDYQALSRILKDSRLMVRRRVRRRKTEESMVEVVDRILRVALIFFSSATAATLLGAFPSGAEWLAVVSAVLAAVSGTMQHGRAALKFAEFAVFWGRLHRDYEELWNEIETYAIAPADAARRLRLLQDKPESIDRQASTSRTRRKLMLDCLADAEKMALAR